MSVRGWLRPLAVLVVAGLAATARAEGEGTGFSFHPSVEVANVWEDEPLLGGSRRDDFGFWITPRVELGYRMPDVRLGADLGLDLRRYIRTDELRDEFPRLCAFAEAGLWPGLSVKLENAFVPVPHRLGLPEDHGANLVQANRLDGEVRYWHELFGKSEIEVGGRGRYFVSESFAARFPGSAGSVVDPSFRADFLQGSGFAQVQTPLGARTSAHLLGEFGHRDFRDAGRSDHTNVSVLAGLRTERQRGLELELSAGYGWILFDAFSNRQQPIGRARVRQTLPHGWSWHGLVENRFRSQPAGNEVFEASGELGLAKRFGEHVDASVDVFVAHYDDRGPANLYGGVESEVGYAFASQGRVSAAYRHWHNRGDASLDDVVTNSVFLRFSYRH